MTTVEPATNHKQQIVWNYAQDIANAFPEEQRDQYREAAFTFRFPYWDWALYPALPDVVSQSLITINTPEGWQTVDNPLYSYEFQSNATGNGFPSPYPVGSPRSGINIRANEDAVGELGDDCPLV
jgi:tyrosinase